MYKQISNLLQYRCKGRLTKPYQLCSDPKLWATEVWKKMQRNVKASDILTGTADLKELLCKMDCVQRVHKRVLKIQKGHWTHQMKKHGKKEEIITKIRIM